MDDSLLCIHITLEDLGPGFFCWLKAVWFGFGLLVFHLPKTTMTREGTKKDDSSALVKEQ